ncbi:hypothetical protein CDCA_CDCA01G0346 [Cyanidium caldarium]|uniref:U3 small nucleolar RNA-associated protein 14 n=1 Tax=Cyanidium caldarium TaxID=2771 RepID=A0AAV9IQ50_CYACA|nr:hypothetical protein CDCA_CDCA01G0346 [Cyanidium caldarium]
MRGMTDEDSDAQSDDEPLGHSSDAVPPTDSALPEALLENILGHAPNRARWVEEVRGVGREQPLASTASAADLTDFLASLPEHDVHHSTLKRHLERLEQRSARQRLAAPLHRQAAERIREREAGRATQQAAAKWQPLVRRVAEAHHVSFPLPPHRPDAAGTTREVAGPAPMVIAPEHHVPETPLERQVASALQQQGVRDEREVSATEQLALNRLTREEVERRRGELAKMRSLLFYYERKAKRVKRVKSKAFRKMQKRRQEHARQLHEREQEELLASLVAAGTAGEGGDAEEVALVKQELLARAQRRERQRALERTTQRHRNTSRWVQRQLHRGHAQWDEGTRAALQEQVRRGEELRRRASRFWGAEEGEWDEEEEEEEGEGEERALESNLALPMEALRGQRPAGAGLLQLPFMRRALERDRNAALEQMEPSEEEVAEGDRRGKADIPGRRTFGGAAAAAATESSSEHSDREEKVAEGRVADDGEAARASAVSWAGASVLAERDAGEVSRRRMREMPAEAEQQMAASTWNTDGGAARTFKSPSQPTVQPENPWLQPASVSQPEKDAETQDANARDDCDDGSGPPEDARIVTPAKHHPPVDAVPTDASTDEQRQWRQLAFAGAGALPEDEAEFAARKAAAAEEQIGELADAPPPTDDILPGWGQWAGDGLVMRENTFMRRKRLATERARAQAIARRRDRHAGHVLLSERRIRAAADALQIRQPPVPFQTAEQYEAATVGGTPLGREWVPVRVHHRLVRPPVRADRGVPIPSLRLPQ